MMGRNQRDPSRRTAPTANTKSLGRTTEGRQRFRALLLATLPGPDKDPVSTNDLGDYFQLDPYDRSELLWTSLDQMARDGLVERILRPGLRLRYWRRTPTGHHQVQGAGAEPERPVMPAASPAADEEGPQPGQP